MNITELARRLRVSPEELLDKLPELGFSIGRRAIKVDNRIAQRIQEAWSEMRRKERLKQKVEEQKALSERRAQKKDPSELTSIELPAVITVREFASQLDLPVARLMQELMRNGILASINERIDFDTASIIAEDLGFHATLLESTGQAEDTEGIDRIEERMQGEKEEDLEPRPPVVVVMGHVDHGKTKLLDVIRTTNVVDTEAGGITQHIGAYQAVRNDRLITFIDTPGHEAFTMMRSRGAKVADVAILVVAADDGVQPQTKEAINIIKSAELPFVVALNKIDRPEANLDRVKGELAELGITPEDWGGNAVMVPISAKVGTNIDQLLDMLLLVADIAKDRIRANPHRLAIGTVVESHVDPGSGPEATILVQSGTLHTGDALGVRGTQYGRVRAMQDWKGETIKDAPPSTPVKIIGWKVAPAVGDIMEVPERAKDLKKMRSTDLSVQGTEEVAVIRHTQNEDSDGGEKHSLNLIIRSDVLGSLEAILGMLDKIKHENVRVSVVAKGLGNLNDSDVLKAEASGAILIGFNVQPMITAEELAREKNVEIRLYSVIYKFFEDVLEDLEKLLPSETVITELGKLEVLANFKKTDSGWVIGGVVKDGKVKPKAKLRLKRGEEYIGEGEIGTLQSGKSDAKEVKAGQECGIQFKGRTKPEVGDILEVYTMEREKRILDIEGISMR